MILSAPGTLLPDTLKQLWAPATRPADTTDDDLWREQQRLMDEYRAVWSEGLALDGHTDLKESLLWETSDYMGSVDPADVERKCRAAVQSVKDEWHGRSTAATDRQSVERFYDETEAYVFDLVWWHTLADDLSPLAYVVALRFAAQRGCIRYLDFGAGVGSAGIIAARHGFEVTLADISTNLLRFARWRFARRNLTAALIDLKSDGLPNSRYEIVTAMDVWEHLVDPVATVDLLCDAIVPGGYLFGRFAAQPDPDYPQHIVTDFEPTFRRLAERGFVEVWRDDWLWGHQVFQKQA